jgi:hypothetical protein
MGIIAPLVPGVGLNYESLPVIQKVYGGSLWYKKFMEDHCGTKSSWKVIVVQKVHGRSLW